MFPAPFSRSLLIIVVTFGAARFAGAQQKSDLKFDPNCDPKWKSISPRHTMCIIGHAGSAQPLSQATRDTIVTLHNTKRASVDPPAADMAKVYWDDELALAATAWAAQCIFDHDEVRLSPTLGAAVDVGQNLGRGYTSWSGAVGNWYGEAKDYQYGVGSATGKTIGHYAQIVQATIQRVGCGQANCGSYSTYVCNYAPRHLNVQRPYENSTLSCSGCPNTCDASGKLCDCQGGVCLHYGQPIVANCTCDCTALYKGQHCQDLNCPERDDARVCGPDSEFNSSSCGGYFAPLACPYMCKVCSHNCGDKQCYNKGTMDWKTCQCSCTRQFEGDTCQTLKCASVQCQNGGTVDVATCKCRCKPGYEGDYCAQAVCGAKLCLNGGTLDRSSCRCICSSRVWSGELCEIKTCPLGKDDIYCGPDNRFTPSQCKSSFVSNDVCPYMCNVCPHACGGKVCQHAGVLDYKNCSCGCFDLYNGDFCEKLACPVNDQYFCGATWAANCQYSYNRKHCPYFCGVCRKGCTIASKPCLNGGTLDEKRCTCQCTRQYTGDTCQLSTEGLRNVALGKTAEMSSVSLGASAGRAVDGNNDTFLYHGSCINTALAYNPWWYVDLGSEYRVEAVVITNRGDREGYFLQNFDVEVFDGNPKLASSTKQLCYHYNGAMPEGTAETLVCTQPRSGQYVRITLAGDRLHFCEVQVLARTQ